MAKFKNPDSIRFVIMLGANMKYLRLNRKSFMPQKVPAHHIGVTFQQVNKYESGKNFESLSTLSLFIEKFYNELCSANNKNLSSYFYNHVYLLS